MKTIPFNKPYMTGNELNYISDAVKRGKISGDGYYTFKCQDFFKRIYGFKRNLLTTSCTDALEMAAILLDISEGDEVIMPSFTFVSTANAFILRGAKLVFVDSNASNPNMDVDQIENLINTRTKAIVVVHYAGIAVDMDKILALKTKYKLYIVEDAAQAIDSYYNNMPLGGFGDLAAFSFHETKNIISGEGGLLVVNNQNLWKRAEVIREKGTNRSQFFRGEIDKYGWVDIGSSYLPSDIIGAFLFAQLECLADIQSKRKKLWDRYHNSLLKLEDNGLIKLPNTPEFATNNAHIFYIICSDIHERTALIDFLKSRNIHAVFHYLSLHKSEYYLNKHDGRELKESDRYMDTLLRLPLYNELSIREVDYITETIKEFYKNLVSQ